MRAKLSFYALFTVFMVAIFYPATASAEYSKAGTSFTYDKVRVKLYDPKHNPSEGTSTNRAGYIHFENGNTHAVTLNYKVYGHMRGDKSMKLIDRGSFQLNTKKTSKDYLNNRIYDYGDHLAPDPSKGWDEYFVAIEVDHNGLDVDENAKNDSTNDYSKAGTKFKYNGVSVVLRDPRHRPNEGTSSNKAGYVEYANHNDVAVLVNWKVYGHMIGDKKMVLVDSGSIELAANQGSNGKTYKEIYDYRDDKADDFRKGFDEFFVSIKVTKVGGSLTSTINAKNHDSEYKKLMKKYDSNATLNQDDYSLAIDLLTYYFSIMQNDMAKLMSMGNTKNFDKELENFNKKYAVETKRYEKLGNLLAKALDNNRLNTDNLQKFQALATMIESIMPKG